MNNRVPPLTEQQVTEAVSGKKRRKLFDGHGLYLDVTPTGSKIWRMKFRGQRGNENTLTFGHHPEVSLALARCRCSFARQMLLEGLDPRTEFNATQIGPARSTNRHPALPAAIDRRKVVLSAEYVGRLAVMLAKEIVFPAFDRAASDEILQAQMSAMLERIEHERSVEVTDLLYDICADIVFKTLGLGVREAELIAAMNDARLAERRVC